MVRFRYIVVAAITGAAAFILDAAVAFADNCSSEADCQQTQTYNTTTTVIGTVIAVGVAVISILVSQAGSAAAGAAAGAAGAAAGTAAGAGSAAGTLPPPSTDDVILEGSDAIDVLVNEGLIRPVTQPDGSTSYVPTSPDFPGDNPNVKGVAWTSGQNGTIDNPVIIVPGSAPPPGGSLAPPVTEPPTEPPPTEPPPTEPPPTEPPPTEPPPTEPPPTEPPPTEPPPTEPPPTEPPPTEPPPTEPPPTEPPPTEPPPTEPPPTEPPPTEPPPTEPPPTEPPPTEPPPTEPPPTEPPPPEEPPEEPPTEEPPTPPPPAMTDPPSEAGMTEALGGSSLGDDATKYIKDHNIGVVFDTSDGSYWDAAHNRIVINAKDNQDAGQILVHEVNHAENNAATNAAWNSGSKTTYVDTMIDQETQGTVESIQSNQQLRDSGKTPPHTFPLENEYNAARNKAMADYRTAHPDADPADVTKAGNDAGYARVKRGFENGEVKASTNGQSYKDYYGNSYDSSHPARPTGGTT